MNKRILFITHVKPYPPAAGNEIRILRLLEWLSKNGFKISFILTTGSLNNLEKAKLLEIVDEVFVFSEIKPPAVSYFTYYIMKVRRKVISHIPQLLKQNRIVNKYLLLNNYIKPLGLYSFVKRISEIIKPDIVLVEYIFLASLLKHFKPPALKIIDTHDVFYEKRRFRNQGIIDAYECTKDEERRYLENGDIILTSAKTEARKISELVPKKSVIAVPVDFTIEKAETIKGHDTINKILIVASDNPFNVDGVNKFLSIVWPKIRMLSDKNILRIVGKVTNCIDLRSEGIEAVLYAQNISDEYRNSTVVVNPVEIGTSIKIKTVEALCFGKPLIVFPNGVEGIEYDQSSPPFCLVNNWDELLQRMQELITSASERKVLENRAFEFAKINYSSEQVYKELHECFISMGLIPK